MAEVSRRAFLGILTAATAVAVASPALVLASELDPERLLWVPGAKTIFLPPVRLATEAEITSLTGVARVRIRHQDEGGEQITVMSEALYAQAGHLLGPTEVHFANGGVAYARGGPMTLSAARARANAQLAMNTEMADARAEKARRLREARREASVLWLPTGPMRPGRVRRRRA
jgi:hypothetical protein